MKEHKLLYGGKIKPEPFKRNFIRFRTPTVIDIFSRKVLIHMLKAKYQKRAMYW
jgi:hypothetical protein